MESAKSLLGITLACFFLLSVNLLAEEASPIIKFINPINSLPAPGNRIKIDYQAENLPANSEVFLASILDNQLVLIKSQASEAPGGLSFFAFPAPLQSLKYFSLVTANHSIISQGEIKELSRDCLPSSAKPNPESKQTSLDLLTNAKNLEQEIQNFENAQKNLEKIKQLIGKNDEQA